MNRLALTLALVLFGAAAHANNVTLRIFDGPTGAEVTGDLTTGHAYRLSIAVTRDAGTWTGTTATLVGPDALVKTGGAFDGPDVVVFAGAGASGAAYAPTTAGPTTRTPRWTLPDTAANTAETLELTLDFALDPSTTLDRKAFTFAVNVEADTSVGNVPFDTSMQRTNRAEATLQFHNWQIFRRASYDHPALGPGMMVRYAIRTRDDGGNALRPVVGSPIYPAAVDYTITVGSSVIPFRAFAGTDNTWQYPPVLYSGGPSIGYEFDLGPDGTYHTQEEVDYARTTTANVNSRILPDQQPILSGVYPNAGIYPAYALHQEIDVFIPCSVLNTSTYLDRRGPEWSLHVRARATAPRADGTYQMLESEQLLDPPDVYEACNATTTSHTYKGPDFSQGTQATIGSFVSFFAYFQVPVGATYVDDAVIVDELPPHGEVYTNPIDGYVSACTTSTECAHGTCIDGTCEDNLGFRPYYCDAPAEAHLGRAAFLTYRNATSGPRCVPARYVSGGAFNGTYTTPVGFNATHMVYWAQRLEDKSVLDDGISDIGFGVYLKATVQPSGGLLENTIWFGGFADNRVLDLDDGVREPEAVGDLDAEAGDFFEDDAFLTIVDYGCLNPMEYTSGPRQLTPGACSWAAFLINPQVQLQPIQGAVLRVTRPAGITVQNIVMGGSPSEPYEGITWDRDPTGTSDIDGIITYRPDCTDAVELIEEPRAGDPEFVWRYNDCKLTHGEYLDRIFIEFCTSPTYPYLDGPTLPFTLTVASYDNAPDFEGQGERCVGGYRGPADGRRPADQQAADQTVVFTMQVLGRQTASVAAVCAEGAPAFSVQAANPSGKALHDAVLSFAVPAGATFDSVSDTTPETVVQVRSSGGTWVALGALPANQVAEVRLVGDGAGFELSPYVGAMSFVVHLVSSAGDGASLSASGAIDTTELGETVASAQPFVVGSCRPLTIHKFHDPDRNGVQSGGEASLSGWTFAVRNASDALVATVTTDVAGNADVVLPAGTYTVTETLPSVGANGVAWQASTQAGESRSVTTSGAAATLSFGNVCECTLACGATCVPNGDTTATCVAGPDASCNDNDMCTTDACVPGSGCGHDAVVCEGVNPTFYAPVAGAGGPVGAIRCELVNGTPVCDTEGDADGDGRPDLKIYPEAAGACGP